jgi:hypothetical protein
LVLLIALAGAASFFLGRANDFPVTEDGYPAGRWHPVPSAGGPGAAEVADLTRVLSLPYLQGTLEAGSLKGVGHHDPERAWPGLNLYSSGHAPEAFLMDMDGRVLHRWQFSFAMAFPDRQPDMGSLYFRRVALLPDGDLLAMYQGWGLIRINRDSSLVWALPLPGFNDFHVEGDRILLLTKAARTIPEINPESPVLEDSVAEIVDGKVVRQLSLLELFRESPYASLLEGMADRGDILHSNTVSPLGAAASGQFQSGQLLVSLREVDVIGVVDPTVPEVVWAARGAWRRQHEPVLLPSGRILLFDNQGSERGWARVIEIDPETREVTWSYGDGPDQEMLSAEGGSVARLPNGNTLITVSETGRALEVTPDGEIVWDFFSPHRAGPNNELVATLWEVLRLDGTAASWLD